MADLQDEVNETSQRAKSLSEQMEALVAEAHSKLDALEKLYRDIGIEKGAGARFINNNDRVPAQERERAKKELEAFRQEVENDIRAAVDQAKGANAKHKMRVPLDRRI